MTGGSRALHLAKQLPVFVLYSERSASVSSAMAPWFHLSSCQ